MGAVCVVVWKAAFVAVMVRVMSHAIFSEQDHDWRAQRWDVENKWGLPWW
jgi:hypothetical protein